MESPATGHGINIGNSNIDILGNQRNSPPDLGAYNAVNFDN